MKHEKSNMELSETVPSAPVDKLLTVEQLADLFNMNVSQVYDLVRRTDIPHIRLSENRIRFLSSAVTSWLERKTVVRKVRR